MAARTSSRSSRRPSSSLARRPAHAYVQHPHTGKLHGPYPVGSTVHKQALAAQAAIAKTPPPPSKGMTTGEKVVLGAVAGAAVLGIFLLTRPAAAGTNPPGAQPAPTPTPSPGATGAAGPTGATGAAPAATPSAQAVAMQTVLQRKGYCQSDSATYSAYQTSKGLTADGYPGSDTMNALQTDLGVTAINGPDASGTPGNGAALALYPWKKPGEAGAVGGGGWVSGNVPAAFVGGSPTQWNPTNASGCGT